MINETFPIQVEGSLPDTRLITYIQDYYEEINIQTRPLILICPGGAYAYTSPREAEAFAMQFLAMGCHAAVLKYSCAPAVYPTALTELASSIALIRKNAEKWRVRCLFRRKERHKAGFCAACKRSDRRTYRWVC